MCCTPYVATIVAGVLSIFQCFTSLCWNIPLLLSLSSNNTHVIPLTPASSEDVDNTFIVFGLTLIFALVNIQLLIFACLMLKGNSASKYDWMAAWYFLVNIKSIFNSLVGAYFFYKYASSEYSSMASLRLAALFSGVFFFWPIVDFFLSFLVFKRIIEIMKHNKMVSMHREQPEAEESSMRREGSMPPPYSERPPGVYAATRNGIRDPSPITGWSDQPLINSQYDQTNERIPTLIGPLSES